MSAAVFIRPGRARILPDRLVIFGFMMCGALSGAFRFLCFPQLTSLRLLFGLSLGAMLLFSVSGLGWLFIPLETLVFGNVFQTRVFPLCSPEAQLFRSADFNPFFSSALFLSFFLAAVYGLGASSALRDALLRGSPSARTRYQQKLSAAALCSLVSLANVFPLS